MLLELGIAINWPWSTLEQPAGFFLFQGLQCFHLEIELTKLVQDGMSCFFYG